MTPQEELNWLTPAFRNLFSEENPNLDRFLRLVIDVLDPAAGYLGICSGAGEFSLMPKGCNKAVRFQTAVREGKPFGYKCPECGVVYPFAFTAGPIKAPKRVVITSAGSKVGLTRSESDSGVIIVDNGTVTMPGDRL